MNRTFTPLLPYGNPWDAPVDHGDTFPRARVTLTGEERMELPGGDGWERVETDHGPMLVTGADCGGSCRCDAYAVPLGTPVIDRDMAAAHRDPARLREAIRRRRRVMSR